MRTNAGCFGPRGWRPSSAMASTGVRLPQSRSNLRLNTFPQIVQNITFSNTISSSSSSINVGGKVAVAKK